MRTFCFFLALATFTFTACSQESRSVSQGEVVNVFTACYEKTDDQLFRRFERATGIRVNILYDTPEKLLSSLQQEEQPAADLLILKGICNLEQAAGQGLLQPSPQRLGTSSRFLPAEQTSHWYPITYDPVAIAFWQDSTTEIPPSGYAALAQEQWKGRVLSAPYPLLHTLIASMLAEQGEEATLSWLQQYKENTMAATSFESVFSSPQADSARLALVTARTYLTASKLAQLKLTFPEGGAYVMVQGAGLVKNAPHPEHARRLLAFLLQPETQKDYAQMHMEYPTAPEIAVPTALQPLGDIQLRTTAGSSSRSYCERAAILLQQAGF